MSEVFFKEICKGSATQNLPAEKWEMMDHEKWVKASTFYCTSNNIRTFLRVFYSIFHGKTVTLWSANPYFPTSIHILHMYLFVE